ncbi:SRPBCC domain-containing protein [Sphingomonas cavernae]|uniref:ATPase n=1 Tax=Sphingomonas cavernae TaxID=2320861 RepID=A0A418WSB0_9SPHN|nr:SRPBCC domain-containing protein [Sphingomonas cavernae]RJF94097.1 ATPase [Sphingomonas cavernae]
MPAPPPETRTDTAARIIRASPQAIYRAFVDAHSLMTWLPPEGMTGRALIFEPHAGGRYRIELSYNQTPDAGVAKTSDRTDISTGRFLELVPDARIVQSVEFESGDPAFAGVMVMTWALEAAPEGTRVTVTAANVPHGIAKADHDAGLQSSLENLARFFE